MLFKWFIYLQPNIRYLVKFQPRLIHSAFLPQCKSAGLDSFSSLFPTRHPCHTISGRLTLLNTWSLIGDVFRPLFRYCRPICVRLGMLDQFALLGYILDSCKTAELRPFVTLWQAKLVLMRRRAAGWSSREREGGSGARPPERTTELLGCL